MFVLFSIQLHGGASSTDIRAVLRKVVVHSVLFSELSLSGTKCVFSVDRNHPLGRHMYVQESLESCSLL